MSTQAQIDANRRNAQLSTGPRTAEGKAVVRRNAFKHGLRAQSCLETEENPDYFDTIYQPFCLELQPLTPLEESYVERMAICQYKLIAMERTEDEALGDHDLLERIWRHQARLERTFDRALASLKALQKERKAQPQPEAEIEPEAAAARENPNPIAAVEPISPMPPAAFVPDVAPLL